LKLRVLGCWGGELGERRTTCFLVDDHLAIDAGALTASLSMEELLRVDDILLTHAHFDHVKDVPLLADLVASRRDRPVVVHGSTGCVQTLREDVFNGRLWPDFTRIPRATRPALAIRAFPRRRPFRIGRYRVLPVPVAHPVESVGFVISDGDGTVAISGDTGPTAGFWREVNAAADLRALFVETSFPTRLQPIADVSGHLTPRTLAGELEKVERDDIPIFLYHLKPAFEVELRRELATLRRRGVRILRMGDEIDLSRPAGPPRRARVERASRWSGSRRRRS
jgi:ribonuclease BN (tRNA processing enzyme)